MKTLFTRFGLKTAVPLIVASQIVFGHALAKSDNVVDPVYQFDQEKIDASPDSFHFLRSFVDYFYLFLNSNKSAAPVIVGLQNMAGWCVGDAHPENFGILIQENGRPMFTSTDFDDSTLCPVGLDLIRLMASSRLYNSETRLDKIMDAYLKGVAREKYAIPSAVAKMAKQSQNDSLAPRESKLDGKKLKRDENSVELSPEELTQIKQSLQSLRSVLSPQTKFLDAFSTRKVGGGSGGLLRYEVLLENGKGTLLHLEMKQQVTPGTYPVALGEIPTTADRIYKTIEYVQSSNPSALYRVVQINGIDMMIRPRFNGNLGVVLSDQSDSDNQEIIRYEAFTLGLIHSRSINDPNGWIQQLRSISEKRLTSEIDFIAKHFNKKFSALK